MVMPEIGFDELPISPVMRDDTLTKKKPKRIVRIATKGWPCVGSPGIATRKMARASVPARTTISGRSRSVRSVPAAPPSPSPRMLSLKLPRIVGSVRPSVMMPEASTAPAPM